MALDFTLTARRRRRACVASAIAAAFALGLTACGTPSAPGTTAKSSSDTPKKPSSPIELTILDGGGDLAGGGQAAIDAFVKANPDLVSKVNYQTAAATDVTGFVIE